METSLAHPKSDGLSGARPAPPAHENHEEAIIPGLDLARVDGHRDDHQLLDHGAGGKLVGPAWAGDSFHGWFELIRRSRIEEQSKAFAQVPILQRFWDHDLEGRFVMNFYGSTILYLRLVSVVATLIFGFVLAVQFGKSTLDALETAVRVVQLVSFVIGLLIPLHVFAAIVCCQQRRKKQLSVYPTEEMRTNESSQSQQNYYRQVVVVPPKHWICSLSPYGSGELIDIFLTAVGSFVVAFHGIASGYIAHGLPTYTTVVCLAMLLGFRTRALPYPAIAYVVVILSHFIAYAIGSTVGFETDWLLASSPVLASGYTAMIWPEAVDMFVYPVAVLVMLRFGESAARSSFVATTRLSEVCDAVEKERAKQERLVQNVYPLKLVPMLKSEGRYARECRRCAVLVNDIAGFTRFCSSVDCPMVFRLLDAVYSVFDIIVMTVGLEKVRTVGDSLIAIAFSHEDGKEDSESDLLENRSLAVVEASLRMTEAFGRITKRRFPDCNLGLRTGCSIGVAWVCVIRGGSQTSTFDVIGDAIATAEKIEPVCPAGEVCCSQEVRDSVARADGEDDGAFSFSPLIVGDVRCHIVRRNDSMPSVQPVSPTRAVPVKESRLKTDDDIEHKGRVSDAKSCCRWFLRFFVGIDGSLRETVATERGVYNADYVRTAFVIVAFTVSWLLLKDAVLTSEFDVVRQLPVYLLGTYISVCSVLGVVTAARVDLNVPLQWLVIFSFWAFLGLVTIPMFSECITVRSFAMSGFLGPVGSILLLCCFPSVPLLLKIPLAFITGSSPLALVGCPDAQIVLGSSFNGLALAAVSLIRMLFYRYFTLRSYDKFAEVKRSVVRLKKEVEENEKLVESVLPRAIALELLRSTGSSPRHHYDAYRGGVVLACFIRGLPKDSLIPALENVFCELDDLVLQNQLVKVKSSGKKYLCVQFPSLDMKGEDLQDRIVSCAVAMIRRGSQLREKYEELSLRIGVGFGDFVGGICGKTRWLWDVYGDTIVRRCFDVSADVFQNTACRLAQAASDNEILCCDSFLKDWVGREHCAVVSQGLKFLKGLGDVETHSLAQQE